MISMTRQGTSRQSADDTHRHSPVLVGMGLIGVVLMATAELVLITTGLNAARLDPDPTWALDCDDTTCTDPWAGARTHYWRVAAGSVVLGLVGWATVGASRPAWRTAPLRRLPRPVPLTGLSASPFLALIPALAALVVSWPMLGGSDLRGRGRGQSGRLGGHARTHRARPSRLVRRRARPPGRSARLRHGRRSRLAAAVRARRGGRAPPGGSRDGRRARRGGACAGPGRGSVAARGVHRRPIGIDRSTCSRTVVVVRRVRGDRAPGRPHRTAGPRIVDLRALRRLAPNEPELDGA